MIELAFEIRPAASVQDVWPEVSTLRGVNAELIPLPRMTGPSVERTLESLPTRRSASASALALWRLVLIDRHPCGPARVVPGEDFDERPQTGTWKPRIHRRRVLPAETGCVARDQRAVEPRAASMRPRLQVVQTVFRHCHRHRGLRVRPGTVLP